MTRNRLCALLRNLNSEDRRLLEWRVVDGWDYGYIAIRLGVPQADLVRRMHRLRTDLKRKAKSLGGT